MKKIILYLLPVLGTLGFVGYMFAWGPLYKFNEVLPFGVLFVLGLPFYLLSAFFTFPYSFVAIFLMSLSMRYKKEKNNFWVHYRIVGLWQLALAICYFGAMMSGYSISV